MKSSNSKSLTWTDWVHWSSATRGMRSLRNSYRTDEPPLKPFTLCGVWLRPTHSHPMWPTCGPQFVMLPVRCTGCSGNFPVMAWSYNRTHIIRLVLYDSYYTIRMFFQLLDMFGFAIWRYKICGLNAFTGLPQRVGWFTNRWLLCWSWIPT